MTPDARIEYRRSTRDVLRGYARRKVREAYFNDESTHRLVIQRIVFTYPTSCWRPGNTPVLRPTPRSPSRTGLSIEHFFPNTDQEQEGSGDVDNQYKNLREPRTDKRSRTANSATARRRPKAGLSVDPSAEHEA